MEAYLCKTCESKTCWNAGHDTGIKRCAVYVPPKPITNYDMLIRRTPEEMAKFISHLAGCPINELGYCPTGKCVIRCKARDCWLAWLKQEARE